MKGWGEKVIIAGYGDLYYGGENKTYTQTFSGTSSAISIVASAVAAVQSWYEKETNEMLSPLEMRKLLTKKGIPQKYPENGLIGSIPNCD